MKAKILTFAAVAMIFMAVSCSKEAGNASSSKAKAKTETVSFSVGIEQEDTKLYFERTGAKEWTMIFDLSNDKMWVRAINGRGAELSSAEFKGGNVNPIYTQGRWTYPVYSFQGEWTYPEENATYSFFFPSSWKNGVLDLRRQDPYNMPYGGSVPGLYYALRGDIEDVKAGEFPKSVVLNPLVALLQVFTDGALDFVAKDSKGGYITGIDTEGKVISSTEIAQEDAVLFSTRDFLSPYNKKPASYWVVVPAGEKLTFYNGTKEIRTTKDSGLKAGTVTNLFFGEEFKVNWDVTSIEEYENSATINGRIYGSGFNRISSTLYYSEGTMEGFSFDGRNYYFQDISIQSNENGYFSATIPNLRENKTYYFMIRTGVSGTAGYGYSYYSDIMSFTTLEPQITVETRAPKYVGFTEAELDSYIEKKGYNGEGSSFIYSKTAKTRDEIIATGKSCGKTVSGLERGTTYYYIAVGSAGSIAPYKVAYGDVMSFTTKTSDSEFGEAVDLGLSVKWRSCNIGAGRPLDSGETYSWGETSEPLSGENYDKYNTGKDGKQVLDLEDDTAHYRLGDNWRMPTMNEFEELMNNCTIISKVNENPPHIAVCSNVPGYTDRSILLPVFSSYGDYGIFLWSSSLFPIDLNDVSPVPEPFCPYSYRAKFYSDRPPYSQFHCGVGLVERGEKFYIRPVLDDK